MDNIGQTSGLIFYDDDATFSNPLFSADLILSEEHGVEITATKNPVEKGVKISDHLRAEPINFKAEVFVTASPIMSNSDRNDFVNIYLNGQGFEGIASKTKAQWEERLSAIFASLERLARGEGPKGASLFKVASSLKVYNSLALVRVRLNRQSSSELSAKISVDFEEVRVVGTKTVPAMVHPVPAGPKSKAKTQAARQSQPAKSGGTGTTTPVAESQLSAGLSGKTGGVDVVLNSVKGLFGI